MKHLDRLLYLLWALNAIMLGFTIVIQGVGYGAYQVNPITIMYFLLLMIYEFRLSRYQY